jgi:hypothetical protein
VQHLRLHERVQLSLNAERESVNSRCGEMMTKRSVDVFDRHGHLLHTYSIVLDEKDCHEAEYEEVALIFAEQSGRVLKEEFIHLRARCA